jgi:dimethylsulfone monooxygenase
VGHVICRPTQQEADEYYRHAFIDNADWGAVERMMALRNLTRNSLTAEEYAAKRHYFAANAIGGYPFVGTPDKVADELANLSCADVSGIAFSLVNYVEELPYICDEVLPRLVRLGLRQAP